MTSSDTTISIDNNDILFIIEINSNIRLHCTVVLWTEHTTDTTKDNSDCFSLATTNAVSKNVSSLN